MSPHEKSFDAGYFHGKAEGQSALSKLASIQLLEDKIRDLEIRNFDLVRHNNELLARARKAEAQIPKIGWPHRVNDPTSLTSALY